MGPKAPEWLRKSHGKSKPSGGCGRGNERGGKGATKEGIAELCEEFGRGVRQQRTRGKTKERAGTLPLALSMFRRNASAHGEVDLLKEV